MSCSEEESTAASVLSQMSQIQQSPSDNVETQGMSVAHQCDVETTASANSSQDMVSMAIGQIMESCQTTLTSPNELEQRGHDAGTSTLISPSDEEESKLQTIVEVSSIKVFPCEYCGKVFNKSYNLKTHHRVHTGERPFPCTVCGHGFANLGDLKRHARTHTGEKPFTCGFCNKSFSDFGSHKRHLRLHTGVKPFKCEQCDREFTRLDSYKNHTRLHTGERPYKCDECQKEFNYLTTYKRHLNIHSGERPYSCDLCEKKFTRLNYLKNHKLNHSKPESNIESKDSSGTNHEGTTSSTVLDRSRISNVTINATADNNHGNNEDDVSDHMIHQVAQALSQGGMQVSVTTVMDNSGTAQPILIQTPVHGSSSDETTLILTQELLNQASTEGNEQLLGFTANLGNKETAFAKDDGSPEEGTETRQLFITQPLFIKPSQDFSADEAIADSQLIHPNFENIVTVTQEDGNIVVSEMNEQSTQKQHENQSEENTSEVTSEDREVLTRSNIEQNAIYIAIDPTQTNVQQILGELQVAVNP